MREIRDGKRVTSFAYFNFQLTILVFFSSGIKLRKVEQIRDDIRQKNQSNLHDVASILARRVAIELTDSESESESEDEDWGDQANETSAWPSEKSEKSKSDGKKK